MCYNGAWASVNAKFLGALINEDWWQPERGFSIAKSDFDMQLNTWAKLTTEFALSFDLLIYPNLRDWNDGYHDR